MENRETMETVRDFIFWSSKIIADGDCSHEIKRRLLLYFLDSSVSKESTCNAGDPGLIPGSGISAEEGIGYPLQDSWPSLVAQLVKKMPEMQKTWVQSLG